MKLSRPRARYGFWTARMLHARACGTGPVRFGRRCPSGNTTIPIGCISVARLPSSPCRHCRSFCQRARRSRGSRASWISTRDWADGPKASYSFRNPKGSTTASGGDDHFGENMVTKLKSFTRAYEVRGRLRPLAAGIISAMRVSIRDGGVRHLFADASDWSAGRRIAMARRIGNECCGACIAASDWPRHLCRTAGVGGRRR